MPDTNTAMPSVTLPTGSLPDETDLQGRIEAIEARQAAADWHDSYCPQGRGQSDESGCNCFRTRVVAP